MYFGGGSRDFRWGIGIPFGYGDYDWYAPYYNYYHRYYYDYEPAYDYPSYGYYNDENNAATAPPPQSMEHPPVPTAGQAARLTDNQLRMMIAVAVDDYNRYLDELNTGEGWKNYFKLGEIRSLVTTSKTASVRRNGAALLADISQRLDAAAKDPAYEIIAQPWSFQTLQVALKEFSLPSSQRQAHTLLGKIADAETFPGQYFHRSRLEGLPDDRSTR